MLSDQDIRAILKKPELTSEQAAIIRTIVQAFADILIENEREHLDEDDSRA